MQSEKYTNNASVGFGGGVFVVSDDDTLWSLENLLQYLKQLHYHGERSLRSLLAWKDASGR